MPVPALLALMLLAACGGEPGPTSAATAEATGRGEEAGERRAALRALREPGTLVSLTCDHERGGLRLAGLSAETGEPVADLTITFPPDTRPGGEINPCLPIGKPDQPKVRWSRLFTPDLTRMAVEIDDPDTGANHIGYLDVVSNEVTDLTEQPSGDFASAPHERAPLFDPSGKHLWFRTEPAGASAYPVWTIDIATGARTKRGETNATGLLPLSDDRAISANSADADWYLPNPSRTAVVGGTAGGGAFLWIPDDASVATHDGAGYEGTALADLSGGERLFAGEFGSRPCRPQGWLNEHSVLCKVMTNYHVLTLADDFGSIVQTGPALLPETDRDNEWVALSPDGRSMVFVSWQGERAALFTVELRPGASPRKLADLDQPYTPIAWS